MKSEEFLNIKKGDKFKVTFDSSFAIGKTLLLVATGKPRELTKSRWASHRVTLQLSEKDTPFRGYFYRNRKTENISFALGNSATHNLKIEAL